MTFIGGKRLTRGEEGQVTLVLLTFIVFLIIGAGVVAKYAGRDSVSSEARTAADAAALAGARVAVSNLLDELLIDSPELDLGCDIGRSAASSYAQQNGAALTSYCFDILTGTARAEVAVERPVSGGTKVQSAAARLRALPVCRDEPADEAAEGAEDAEEEEPKVTCTILGTDFEPGDDLDLGDIARLLEPRLIPN